MAIGMTAFCALVAIGIDLGRIAMVATEAQTAAEIGATAAAKSYITNPNGSYQNDAATVLGMNKMNGTVVPASSTAYALGVVNSSGAFVSPAPNGTSPDAVKASTQVTVQNLFTGVFGAGTTNIVRTAVAAFEGGGSGTPTIPLAIGDCQFGLSHNCSQGNCPQIQQIPATADTGAWMNPTNGGTSKTSILSFFPSPCGTGASTMPSLNVNDKVSLNNGQITDLVDAVYCMCHHGINQFLLPVIACDGNFNDNNNLVTGFVSITIVSFTNANGGVKLCTDPPGGPALKTVTVQSVRVVDPANLGGPGGCQTCGTGTIRMAG